MMIFYEDDDNDVMKISRGFTSAAFPLDEDDEERTDNHDDGHG